MLKQKGSSPWREAREAVPVQKCMCTNPVSNFVSVANVAVPKPSPYFIFTHNVIQQHCAECLVLSSATSQVSLYLFGFHSRYRELETE